MTADYARLHAIATLAPDPDAPQWLTNCATVEMMRNRDDADQWESQGETGGWHPHSIWVRWAGWRIRQFRRVPAPPRMVQVPEDVAKKWLHWELPAAVEGALRRGLAELDEADQ